MSVYRVSIDTIQYELFPTQIPPRSLGLPIREDARVFVGAGKSQRDVTYKIDIDTINNIHI